MPLPRIKVGSITVISLSDGSMTAAPANVWPSVPTDAWQPYQEHFSPDGTLPFNLGSFLIREDDTWSLVDTGFGNRPDTRGGGLDAELQRAEVSPDAISRVIITHLHGDHIGGNTIDVDGKPVPAFKNARYVLQRADWDHYQQPDRKSASLPIVLCADPIHEAGLLDLLDGGQSLSAGISTILTPGHTPGHQSVLISSGDQKVVILGDASHTPIQLSEPDWAPSFDFDPAQSSRTRADLFDRIEQEGLTIAAGHYPYPGFGGVVRVEGKRRWQPLS
jgi:glyoxylase-like metal-dependent hydrolase (beta-lactamase superfamily II)